MPQFERFCFSNSCQVDSMTLGAIKEAIQHLPVEELWKLADRFDEIEEAA
jgi:hypothetical protein